MRTNVRIIIDMASAASFNKAHETSSATDAATVAAGRQHVARALRWQEAWNRGAGWLLSGILASGCCVILLRQAVLPFFPAAAPFVLWLWLAPLFAGLIPLLYVARRPASSLRVAQALESWGHGDGFLALDATATQNIDAAWQKKQVLALQQVVIPPLNIPHRRWLLIAALAAMACWLVPERSAPATSGDAIAPLVTVFEPAQQRLQTLAEAGLLSEAAIEDYQQRLQPLLKDAEDGRLDPGAWQAFERWQAAAEQDAARRQQALDEATEAFNATEHHAAAIAEALRAASNDPELFQDLTQNMLNSLEQENSSISPPQLTPEQAEQLRSIVQQLPAQKGQEIPPEIQQALQEQLNGGNNSGNNSPSFDQQELADAANALREHLQQRQQQSQENGSPCQDGSCPNGGKPGEGWGVNRGPGAAPLELTNDSDATAGNNDGLNQGKTRDQKPGIILSTRSRQPDVTQEHAVDTVTDRDITQAQGQSRRTPIPPRHRATVGRYFSPNTTGNAATAEPDSTEVP